MTVNKDQAMSAVRTLLEYAGDDPFREGLQDTPERVVKAFGEWFAGYKQDPVEVLGRTFDDAGGFDEIVVLKNIRFESHCEHHMVPIIGKAHVAYLPKDRVVGISKLARVVELYGKRLQIQEKMTAQVADAIETVLQPRAVAVVVDATHLCMTTRGVNKPGVSMLTSAMRGLFKDDHKARSEVLALMGLR